MPSPKIKTVALIGANGRLGPAILQALLDKSFTVSVITRASSKSTYGKSIRIIKVDDDLPFDQLVKAMSAQDALVISFAGTQRGNSIKLANAAFEAGVRHIIPADFGSCDSSDERSLELIPLYVKKKDVREHLENLSKNKRLDGSSMSWTSLVTGHFFDYGLKSGLMSIDLQNNTTRIFDGGNIKLAATPLALIGQATAQILTIASDPRVKNKLVYVQGIQTTQNELTKAVEEATGRKLDVEHVNSDDFIKEQKDLLAKDPGNGHVTEELVTVEGIVNTNWDSKGDALVNDLLEIPEGNLEEMVAAALQ